MWDYFDREQYDLIEKRCKNEVEDSIKIYQALQKKLNSSVND